jgi:hypothetical protein
MLGITYGALLDLTRHPIRAIVILGMLPTLWYEGCYRALAALDLGHLEGFGMVRVTPLGHLVLVLFGTVVVPVVVKSALEMVHGGNPAAVRLVFASYRSLTLAYILVAAAQMLQYGVSWVVTPDRALHGHWLQTTMIVCALLVVYLHCRLGLSVPLILDRGAALGMALRDSFRLTRGHTVHLTAFLLVVGVPAVAVLVGTRELPVAAALARCTIWPISTLCWCRLYRALTHNGSDQHGS